MEDQLGPVIPGRHTQWEFFTVLDFQIHGRKIGHLWCRRSENEGFQYRGGEDVDVLESDSEVIRVLGNSSKAHIESKDQNHTLDISFNLKRTVKADVKHGFDIIKTLFSRIVIKSEFWN